MEKDRIKLADGFRPVLFAEPISSSEGKDGNAWVSPVAGQVAKGITEMMEDWSTYELSETMTDPAMARPTYGDVLNAPDAMIRALRDLAKGEASGSTVDESR